MYNKLEKILELLWRDDDLMDQDTLFELQDYVADVALEVAVSEGMISQLIAKFPWLYSQKSSEGDN